VVEGLDVYGVTHLAQVLDLTEGYVRMAPLRPDEPVQMDPLKPGDPVRMAPLWPDPYPDFSLVRGQAQARRALEVAAAGGHNVIKLGMYIPPLCFKDKKRSEEPNLHSF
jgi:magnesium chelatase family protein